MIVLVDTSIWSLALRRESSNLNAAQQQQATALEELVIEGRARLVGLVRQELLSGIKTWKQFAALREELRTFPDVLLEIEDFEEAAQIGNTCRTHGLSVTATDMLLCGVALRRGWAIYTADLDFRRYARHVPIVLY